MVSRRNFLKGAAFLTAALQIPLYGCKEEILKFGICSDLHVDIMPDAEKRMKDFIKSCFDHKVDLAFNIGDMCHPIKKNESFIKLWNDLSLEHYSVLGNHDMDMGTKEDCMKFIGMKSRYYSFDKGPIHFVMLDPNNLLVDGKYVPYGHANFYIDYHKRGHVDPEQMAWLENDLRSTDKVCITFSHQSFQNPYACQNQKEVRALFEKINRDAGFKKVAVSFSGHDHTDYHEEINGIHYIQINSMSNQWVGDKYRVEGRFSKAEEKDKPLVTCVVPYADSLYAMVEIKNGMLFLKGVQSKFIEPMPSEIGVPSSIANVPLTPTISDRKLNIL